MKYSKIMAEIELFVVAIHFVQNISRIAIIPHHIGIMDHFAVVDNGVDRIKRLIGRLALNLIQPVTK